MFKDESLENHLETASVIRLESAVIAEWNMNVSENIAKIGNYRYRPSLGAGSKYNTLPNSFDPNDSGNFYTNATDADIVVDGGYDDDGTPKAFLSKKQKEKMLYSLEDCLSKFRPRSGINKVRFFEGRYIHNPNPNMSKRPRYYMADYADKFKYWSSYRTEDGTEYGISRSLVNGGSQIEDTAPFVVYKNSVPTNRIVVKMQTNVGSIDLGPFSNSSKTFSDPLYGDSNATIPVKWRVQYLKNNNWIDAVSFNQGSVRRDGTKVIKSDGYVELAYGLIVPDRYRDVFIKAEELSSETLKPEESINGYAYLIKANPSDIGTYHIWFNNKYETFTPVYGWYLAEEETDRLTNFVTDLVSPEAFTTGTVFGKQYREFEYIDGIRIVVETMNRPNATFDLIEMSPRLAVDMSDKTVDFTVKKSASDLGVSGLPVGQLLAGVGSVTIFDYDLSFLDTNTNSIIHNYLNRNVQFKFYEKIIDVDGYDYFVPIKTMYSEGFPEINSTDRTATIQLRDLFFYFESLNAPELLLQNTSLSSAVSTLLDYIGFSNYVFKRTINEKELIIPYFYTGSDKTIIQVLNDLAVSSQSAMFFDEYNNFIVMSKNYMMPSESQRPTDKVLRGSIDMKKDGVYSNKTTAELANIIDISSQDNHIYNDGKILYKNRYLQRSYGSLKQASMIDRDKTWIYKPALLWQVSGTENTKSVNDSSSRQANFLLSAIPLNSDLSADVPSVVNNQIVNNTIDLGEAVYWIARYNGYFYSSGEIIRYDAVQFNIPKLGQVDGETIEVASNNVWITSTQEYQNYFSKLSFNGKIYPTGLVRIYSEPEYEVINGITRLKNGAVAKHGRGQFGTQIVKHVAGLDPYWSSASSIRGCDMEAKYLFGTADRAILAGVSSENEVLTVPSSSNIKVGQLLTIVSGTGDIGKANDVSVTEIVDETTIKISKTPTTALQYAVVMFKMPPPKTTTGAAGKSNAIAQQASRNGVIRNFLSSTYVNEKDVARMYSTQTGTIQSSAFVMTGPSFTSIDKPNDFMSYVYKPLDGRFTHFGTRMRLIGTIDSNADKSQTPIGSTPYYVVSGNQPDKNINVSGGSAGLGIMINPENNNGYYFELVALTGKNIQSYQGSDQIHNVLFYKVVRADFSGTISSSGTQTTITGLSSTLGISIGDYLDNVSGSGSLGLNTKVVSIDSATQITVTSENPSIAGPISFTLKKAIPVKLYGGTSNIIVDNGQFTGQYRIAGETNPTVYDIAVEYQDFGNTRRFYLYINNRLFATVDDTDPLPVYNNMALFVRGSSRAMFENIYAISNNYTQNTVYALNTPINSIFDANSEVSVNEAFRKYALSGVIQNTYLTGISQAQPPQYNIYFDEFGSIMREAAYLNIKYDKAYPALHAKISETFNNLKGYTISGFRAGAYGAEFLVFNATDTALNLDETTGNYLRIQGVTFTQDSARELTVDEFFNKNSDFANPQFNTDNTVVSPIKYKNDYLDIKTSRMTHGRKEFVLDAIYIQNPEDANELMSWMSNKIMKPRKSVGVKVFGMPTLQLGDIVKISYKDQDGIDEISDPNKRFIVYSMQYNRTDSGPVHEVFLSEVI